MIPALDLSGLDQGGAEPLFRQIHGRIATAVHDGRLAPGARLPSARSLAAQLSIARGTVDAAYQLLAGEGYIVSRGAAGTLVDPALDRRLLKAGRIAQRDSSPRAAVNSRRRRESVDRVLRSRFSATVMSQDAG